MAELDWVAKDGVMILNICQGRPPRSPPLPPLILKILSCNKSSMYC